jgi:hypothetical protein
VGGLTHDRARLAPAAVVLLALALWTTACASRSLRSEGFEHVVQQGETLSAIARHYGVSASRVPSMRDSGGPRDAARAARRIFRSSGPCGEEFRRASDRAMATPTMESM